MSRWTPSAVLVVGLAFVAPAVAQKDRILFTDGTEVTGVTVSNYNLREITWKKRGSEDSRSSDMVADVDVEKVKEQYKRAYANRAAADAPATFLGAAERQKSDPFIAQFGYVEAAKLFVESSQYAEAFQVLEQLATELPDSAFVPMLYRVKCEYYLGRGKDRAADAMSVAKKFETAAQTQGYPEGYVHEARYYKLMADASSGALNSTKLRAEMSSLSSKAARWPNVANRARLEVADTLRLEKKFDQAKADYEDLLSRKYASPNVLAGAWLGMGHVHFAAGDPSNREPYRHALLAFLHVYIETPKALPGIVSESLHMGSQAAEKWGGEDAAMMANRLRYLRDRDFPENPWR